MSYGNSDIGPCSWKFSEGAQTVRERREIKEVFVAEFPLKSPVLDGPKFDKFPVNRP